MPSVRATVRYQAETVVSVYVQEDIFGHREVEDAVCASGELIDVIELDVVDYTEEP